MNRPPYHRALALKLTNVVRTWGLTWYGRICPYSLIGGSEVMMEPISIEEFVKLHVKSNPGEKPEDVRGKLQDAVRRKQAGVVCMICGQPIWAIGSAIAEWNGCFTCITGETDHADDYEIDEVCSY